MEAVDEQKIVLRELVGARRLSLTAANVRAASAAIWERLAQLSEFASATRIFVYVSQGNEVETHGLIRQLLALGRQVCVPAFDDGEYVMSALTDFDADLTLGKFGILEPKQPRPVDQADVLLVPGVAFDSAGHRLGRGFGFFDRLLANAGGVKVGVAYDFQVVNDVPVSPHDVRMDYIVTETRTIKGN